MMKIYLALLAAAVVASQQIGDIPEVHPRFSTHQCSNSTGCVREATSIVLDATWRNLEELGTGASCLTNDLQLNKTICPTAKQCGEKCALQGADYRRTGVDVHGNSVTLHMYEKYKGDLVAVGPQIYLLDDGGEDYKVLHLLSQEISFEVDVSNLPCGMNGGMYMAEMEPSGGRSHLNPAGSAYGTGYCDSQCYTSYAFVNGVANIDSKGTCCNEMDLWEANARSNQLTPHPCNLTGFYACESVECEDGKKGVCDKAGCGFNPYALGAHDFYGLDGKVDTNRSFRVVTRFITHDETRDGKLVGIRRLYVQDGRTIPTPEVTLRKNQYNSITPDYCKSTDATSFARHGGLEHIGGALQRGMVLVMGIWNEGSDNLNWLDAGDAGPCNRKEGSPAAIKKNHAKTSVTFSDIRHGDFGTTY